MNEGTVSYTVRVHEDSDGSWWAKVDELPGCFASGFNQDDLAESLREAIELYLSTPDNPVSVRPTAVRERVETRSFELSPS